MTKFWKDFLGYLLVIIVFVICVFLVVEFFNAMMEAAINLGYELRK